MKRLEGKTALVTGGNTGIGRAIALAYAREGADVAFTWIEREPEAQSLAREIEALGRKVLAVRCDVTQEADVVAGVARDHGPLGTAALRHVDVDRHREPLFELLELPGTGRLAAAELAAGPWLVGLPGKQA